MIDLFDSSAVLAYLARETGADVVEQALTTGRNVVSAANWSEVAQKVAASGISWQVARAVLLSLRIDVEPVQSEDAELAARLWVGRPQLSLGDRLCLATGERLGAIVWTADRAWGDEDPVRQVR
ncbi:MAG TPA: type II toxin-antitoxin system VapC family toxin [Mycobacteriales bacterium]|nr:type II toxin-antitoxin system VapC family toxin [Mycobacteriales bacterium]